MTAVIDDAIDDYEHKTFWRQMAEAVARTRAEPEVWADYLTETAVFDNAADDGLRPEETPRDLTPEGFDADRPR
ncbi:hypothetical protein [Microbispora sp. ATCC PTA-5024]|uniref:hypothetical protein n=1 Tax=Microbispora sp. ATCC PTA-5024 TaxID=316330 RepID=UPI0003DB9488|nr:hypothetical protein [Microbispora sp. ATCC PTA-5024]ETK32445.1 hypothetical protein MPTA5024_29815 [Microbispora sp. ATCC PTA-5024]